MKPIIIGKDAAGRPIQLTEEMRRNTHMHVVGSSGTGKSKFLEWMIRKDIREGHGFCVIDWHGKLYNDVLRYCAQLDVGLLDDFRKIVLLNPSRPDFISGFNPFMNPGDDISTQVSKRIDATIKPWGANNTNETPTFARVARVLYTFMAENKQTLPNAASLLEFERRELRNYAISKVSDAWVKAQWKSLQSVTSAREWREQVLSTDNRLARFIGSTGVRRFMGMEQNNIDLLDIMDSGKILLVNLGASGFLDREAARVFASLFLNEFFDAAMLRANRAEGSGKAPNHYMLYLDEFQEYITDDIAAMLDQVRKGGLHIVLAHQHLGHFADNPRLRKSVFTNARIRAVFGGLDYEDACVLGNEMFLPDLNTRQIKKAYYHTIHLYEEQTRTVSSHTSSHGSSRSSTASSGSGSGSGSSSSLSSGQNASQASMMSQTSMGIGAEGWFTNSAGLSSFASDSSSQSYSEFSSESESAGESDSESFGETVVPVWVPIPTQELTTESEWTREEKLSRVAQLLKEQMQQHCFIKLGGETTQPLMVPSVKNYGLSEAALLEYQREVYKAQGALPAAHVDLLLEQSHQTFLAAASPPGDAAGAELESATEEGETITQPPQARARAGVLIWNRSGQPSAPGQVGFPGLQSSHRKRGPKPDVENHAKVIKIISGYGEHWTADDNLREICDTLDQQAVPIPKTWPMRSDGKSRSWARAFENYPHLVVKAIKDRCKMVSQQV